MKILLYISSSRISNAFILPRDDLKEYLGESKSSPLYLSFIFFISSSIELIDVILLIFRTYLSILSNSIDKFFINCLEQEKKLNLVFISEKEAIKITMLLPSKLFIYLPNSKIIFLLLTIYFVSFIELLELLLELLSLIFGQLSSLSLSSSGLYCFFSSSFFNSSNTNVISSLPKSNCIYISFCSDIYFI